MFLRSILFLTVCFTVQARIVSNMPATEVKASEWFLGSANGINLFIYDNPVAPIATFEADEPILITLWSKKDVRWCDIRPKSLQLAYTISGSSILIRVPKPCNFTVEINNMPYREPLQVFVNPITPNKPTSPDSNYIVFEKGKYYLQGKILLTSNKTLYIENGAVVEGYVEADHANNIRIIGTGILDGINNKTYRGKDRTRFMEFRSCSNVSLSGITLVRATTWEIVPINSQNIRMDNIHIVSEAPGDDGIDIVCSRFVTIQNSYIRTKDDNIVIKCANRKDFKAQFRTEDVLVQNCVFWNTIWGNAIEIGFELAVDTVQRVVFQNNDIIHVEAGAAIAIHNTDKAVVTNILFDNIRIEEARQKLFDISIFLSRYSDKNPFDDAETSRRYWHGVWDNAIILSPDERQQYANLMGKIEQIRFRNIAIISGPEPFSVIAGYDSQHMVRNLLFENITYLGKKYNNPNEARFSVEHADQLQFK